MTLTSQPTGPTGPTDTAGSAGSIGTAGSADAAGSAVGTASVAGSVGAAGSAAGTASVAGSVGAAGSAAGTASIPGSAGIAGSADTAGIAGSDGTAGSAAVGTAGIAGSADTAGSAGSAGSADAADVAGAVGAAGSARFVGPAPVTAEQAVLIVHGRDRTGIVAAVSAVLARRGANIVSLDQYSDNPHGGAFFQRTVFTCDGLKAVLPRIEKDLLEQGLELEFTLRDSGARKRVAIFASKADHCLVDLLWRHRRGELPISVAMVISNHPDTADEVRSFGIPFFHVPSAGPDKSAAEAEHLRLLAGNVDFVVLARYMQILSGDFIERVGVPIINIHHSFLPAFIGAGPYAKAKARGVKLVGATAHYVTVDLDEGPIIEQDVVRVSHAHTVAELQRRGADVERDVLSRAVLWHSQDRVIRDGNHTIVFS
ncbi:hypothetical protein L3i22_065760 [Actinoplanes sp. L3-i22]|nr:hypothetical protein L3i22_065760 [Actinoplanes sp. L3-i22]